MPDLLKNKDKLLNDTENEASFSMSDNEKEDFNNSSDENNNEVNENKPDDGMNVDNSKVNLDRYQDPEGLTVKKMAMGLWFVQNRKHFIFIFMVILAVISVITWGRFFYVFGTYVMSGLKYDDQLAREITTHTIVGHDFFLNRTPKEITFNNIQLIKGENEKYDFIIKATNPNEIYWAEIDSHIKVGGIDTAYETNFILPNETKQFIITGIELKNVSNTAKFINDGVRWHRIDKHKYPNWDEFAENHLDIFVDNILFTPSKKTIITEKIPLNTLDFTVNNNSAYNYWGININIIIYGVNNKILILNEHVLNNFMSSEKRTVSITIPGDYPTIGEIEILPEINITKDDIYIEFDGGVGEIK